MRYILAFALCLTTTFSMAAPQAYRLDTARSTSLVGDLSGTMVQGDLTVRGLTRPITLNARLYRQRGTDHSDHRNLVVLLTGHFSRSAFGATGYAGMVGDTISLRIIARITR